MPGCFTECLQSGKKILALLSHDTAKPLGNNISGTLKLEDRQDGLYITITPDQGITWAQDALRAARNGDWSGFSFGFTVPPGGDSWQGNLRSIHRAELIEVSPVSFPAYTESTISTRNRNNMNNQTVTLSQRDYQAFCEWRDRSINTPPDQDFGSGIYVEDQPIYRGPNALGEQMVDIAIIGTSGHPQLNEARSRYEQMVKREKTLAEKRAAGTGGMIQAVGEDGGLLVQGESAIDLIQHGFGNSAVLSRARNIDLGTSQFIELVGVDETSRADGSRGGGVRVYTDKELALIVQSKTKFEKIRLEPKRLTGMYFASNEILYNAPTLQSEMSALFDEEFAFKGQDLVINGSGSGEAFGILNAPCLVTVDKEAGQAAKTIIFENLVAMKARARMRNHKAMLWTANQDIESQLFQLALPIGTGGSVIPAYIPSADQGNGIDGMLLGWPIVFVEQCATLGTVGDIILGDWSMYYAANKGGIESASSIHLKFDYNQTAFRFVTWFDGQPRLKAPVTPYKGTNTVSPFVTLATRQ